MVSTPANDKQPTRTPITVKLPDGNKIKSTHTCQLNLPLLPAAATKGHIFPALANHTLLSVGVLCDNGCNVTFKQERVDIAHADKIVYSGKRKENGLWTISLDADKSSDVTPTSNAAIETMDQGPLPDLINFLHASCFSPATSTLIKAINNNHFTTWPSFTVQNVQRHLEKSTATAMGHLDQKRRNIRSTKTRTAGPTTTQNEDEEEEFVATPTAENGEREHLVYAAIVEVPQQVTGQINSDQTGAFPVVSSQGAKYAMVVYEYDSNGILVEPLANRKATSILQAYKKIHALLVARGLRPKLQRLDNEASTILKQFMTKEAVAFQLVPPGIHRINAAERAIRTWKNHFVAGLASTDNNFSLHLWDELIEQSVITLNLLRQSRINPKLSAYAQIHGAFDYNRTPIAPPGTRIISHVKADKRTSWAPHGDAGWYTGPAMEHYRCHRVHITKTNGKRITDTVEFFPTKLKMPKLSSIDAAQHAARDLIHALQNPHPAVPFHPLGEPKLEALRELANIFNTTTGNAPDKRKETTPAPRVADQQPQAEPAAAAAAAAIQIPTQEIPDTPLKDLFESPDCPQVAPDFYANSVLHPTTGVPMEYKQLIKDPETKAIWNTSAANKFGRLAQGCGGRVKGTDTINFIKHADVPAGRIVTYARFVCVMRPQKSEPARTRLTVGGNLIDYPGDKSAPTADITTFKLLVNSTLSTPNAKMCCMDVKNYYLNTPLDRPEYMRIALSLIPQEIIDEYKLLDLVHDDGYVYIIIKKGMYGLPQAGILANKLLAKRLGKHGYYQCRHTPGLWKHTSRPITFALVVDDFAVTYVGKEHAHHLLTLLQRDYEAVAVDWEATLYCGITCKWDYVLRHCILSMPGYMRATLIKFGHLSPSRRQNSPHRYNAPNYGAKIQAPDAPDNSAPLTKEEIKRIQQIVGTLLYYARAVDSTMLVTLSALASRQAKATEQTKQDVNRFLDYCDTHPDAAIKYQKSDMVLKIHSDAGYLNESFGRSRVGGHFYLGNKESKQEVENAAILNTTGILRHVANAASESELGGLFVNCKEGVVIRQSLADMGHPQQTTPVITDNSTACGIANQTMKQQRSRAMDMRYHWVRDRVAQHQFNIHWKPGSQNRADYFTKHHAATHHQTMRPKHLYCPTE